MDIIKRMKSDILKVAHKSKEGHVASSFSVLDILWVLYDKILNEDDLFILSKGHASLALYAVLNQKGYISREYLYSFCSFDSILGGHPNRLKISKVVASTGSLGHGFPISVGLALSKKIKNESGRVFCIIGDGECNEGSIWESALLANQYKLDNLVLILDNNHSTDKILDINDMCVKFGTLKWKSGWIDGHNHEHIYTELNTNYNMPVMIEAITIKGKGCKTMENNPEWHHKSPNKQELDMLLEELNNA